MADPSVAPGLRAQAARVSAGVCWQVVRPGAASRAAQDVTAGTGGTFLCVLADSACSCSAAGCCLVPHRVLFKGCQAEDTFTRNLKQADPRLIFAISVEVSRY